MVKKNNSMMLLGLLVAALVVLTIHNQGLTGEFSLKNLLHFRYGPSYGSGFQFQTQSCKAVSLKDDKITKVASRNKIMCSCVDGGGKRHSRTADCPKVTDCDLAPKNSCTSQAACNGVAKTGERCTPTNPETEACACK